MSYKKKQGKIAQGDYDMTMTMTMKIVYFDTK